MTTHVPDISEFQPNVNFAKVATHNGGAAIIRAYNGYRADHAWYGGVRRKVAHRQGVRVLGIYAYLVADRPALDQAREFCRLVGKLAPGEFAVLDIEDPHFTGSQAQHARDWLAYVDQHIGYPGYKGSWVYSYGAFVTAHNLGAIFASRRPTWLAAYGATEPHSPGHSLWQHSDSQAWPGIGRCDCSIFHGSLAQLEARVWTHPTGRAHKPAPRPKTVPHPATPAVHPHHRPVSRPERRHLCRLRTLLRHGALARAYRLIRALLTGKA